MNSEEYINKLFLDAGWHKGRKIKIRKPLFGVKNVAHQNANTILAQFGGLEVGEVGAGREVSASDISFRSEAFDFGSEFNNYWSNLNKSLFAFASAHHDHMLLLVDDDNIFYIFTDPDEQLYKIGGFNETVKRVLLGISYGEPLEKA